MKKTVVVVEDDRGLREQIARILANAQHRARQAISLAPPKRGEGWGEGPLLIMHPTDL